LIVGVPVQTLERVFVVQNADRLVYGAAAATDVGFTIQMNEVDERNVLR